MDFRHDQDGRTCHEQLRSVAIRMYSSLILSYLWRTESRHKIHFQHCFFFYLNLILLRFFLPLFKPDISRYQNLHCKWFWSDLYRSDYLYDSRTVLWIFPRSIAQIDPASPLRITIRNVDLCRSGILHRKTSLREYILSDRCRGFSTRLVNAIARRNANGKKTEVRDRER